MYLSLALTLTLSSREGVHVPNPNPIPQPHLVPLTRPKLNILVKAAENKVMQGKHQCLRGSYLAFVILDIFFPQWDCERLRNR